ncbi:zinc ribbon domain-containing protein [Staphylococcus equorum]|uniref:Cas12f1-like TNB domain-containing protein n=1 Tax=Staphylococcus equorum TaxID=246432 RepID=A0AAP7IGC5_9STAP|nr:zinc ribbon domain-containing protein [Staphylococcus equorum]OEK58858.1 hypothetical protein ASS94_00625 [Staphylococcus equorum]
MNYINVNTLINFIQCEMTTEDIKNIDISQSTLYKAKHNPDYILRMRFENIIKLSEYIIKKRLEKKRVSYVGIDIGTSNILTASDKDMKRTLIIENKRIYNAIKTYNRWLNGKNPTKESSENSKETLLRTIETNVAKLINELTNHYIEPVTFVVGKVYQESEKIRPHYTLYRIFVEKMREEMHYRNIGIEIEDESYTSIICPECNHRDSGNRTNSNQFRCKSCGFSHENDDVVASVNIVKRYLENREDNAF